MLTTQQCSDSKDLAKRTVSDKILKDTAYEIVINPKYDGYQRGLTSVVYNFFDKKTGLGASVNEVLAQKLHKSLIEIFRRRKVEARFGWNEIIIRIKLLKTYYVWQISPSNMPWLNLRKINKKTVLHYFIEIVNKSKPKLINEKNFVITLCKNCKKIVIF